MKRKPISQQEFNTVEKQSKAVWKHLEMIMARGLSRDRVFHDWLDLMIYALQRRDPEYLEIVARYPSTKPMGEREIDFFSNAFAELMVQSQHGCTDILGQIFTDEITRGENGQFFTPCSPDQSTN